LICITGLANVDNAFFTGEYMVFGNGEKQFYPLVSADVVGHEFTHGLVQGLAGLIYKGHSGALNEHISDVMAVCYESWMYHKYNENESKDDDLLGSADWLMGEDLGVTMPYLRNFQDPEKAQQPKRYKGKFYMDPNSNFDSGGVHVNSGIWNHCFFKVCAERQVPMSKALTLWMLALRNMRKDSNFMHFRDLLLHFSSGEVGLCSIVMRQCLDAVGMTADAISDQRGDDGITFPAMPTLPKPAPVPAQPTTTPQCTGTVLVSCVCSCHQKYNK
jgi:Zn-dependent metalloprotease